MDHSIDDGAAVAAARRGDAEAFGVLVERYQEVAFRSAYLILRDAGAAEDLAQEGFVRAYRNLRKFREGQPFRPWLLRIVHNLALNEVRARGRRENLLARVMRLPPVHDPGPEQDAEASERHELVLRAIGRLPVDDRVVLYLRYFLELSEREIAEAIGKRRGTVKSRLYRANARLRAVIEQEYPALRPAAPVEGEGSG